MDYQILFLDANDGVLIKRYKETRRSHPLAGTGRLDKGIEKERVKLAFLKKDADFIIDTSKLLTRELRQELEKIFLKHQEYCNMFVTVLLQLLPHVSEETRNRRKSFCSRRENTFRMPIVLPSTSYMCGPNAFLIKRGAPPTERKARTGEFTPPGMDFWALSKSTSF